MKSAGNILTWVICNAALYYLAYAWLFESQKWAQNLLTFLIWVYAIPLLLGAILSMENLASIGKGKPSPIPAWVNALVNAGLVVALAAQGYGLTALAATAAAAIEWLVTEEAKKLSRCGRCGRCGNESKHILLVHGYGFICRKCEQEMFEDR